MQRPQFGLRWTSLTEQRFLRLVRHQRRWRYVHRGCARGSFTETVTAVPARALHADAYADRGRRHRIAEQYRPRTPVGVGEFLVLVDKAPARV
jgi:uncharacterized NAD(P)/FAD-binding protein YdhS